MTDQRQRIVDGLAFADQQIAALQVQLMLHGSTLTPSQYAVRETRLEEEIAGRQHLQESLEALEKLNTLC